MKRTVFYFLFFVLVLPADNFGQTSNFVYKSLPKEYQMTIDESERRAIISNIPELYDLTLALPKPFKVDGSVDYTSYIQRAMDEHRNVLFPNFPVLINDKGLIVRSNTNLVFNTKSELRLRPTANSKYKMLSLNNVNNVKIYYAVIIGDRTEHKDNKGEWGMGIDIRQSRNVYVFNPIVKDCWGDGICIGASTPSENINIFNAFLDNNRRNGITIGSGRNVNIRNCVISNTHGTRPMAGIDIEPNNNNDIIENITIENVVTFNNGLRGILIALNNFHGKSSKKVNINIKNHLDDGSFHAIGTSLVGKGSGRPLQGVIKFSNPIWINNSKEVIQKYNLNGNAIQVMIDKPQIQNKFIKQLNTEFIKQSFSTNKNIVISK